MEGVDLMDNQRLIDHELTLSGTPTTSGGGDRDVGGSSHHHRPTSSSSRGSVGGRGGSGGGGGGGGSNRGAAARALPPRACAVKGALPYLVLSVGGVGSNGNWRRVDTSCLYTEGGVGGRGLWDEEFVFTDVSQGDDVRVAAYDRLVNVESLQYQIRSEEEKETAQRGKSFAFAQSNGASLGVEEEEEEEEEEGDDSGTMLFKGTRKASHRQRRLKKKANTPRRLTPAESMFIANRRAFLGDVVIPISRLPEDHPVEQWYQLSPKENDRTLRAAVRVVLQFITEKDDDEEEEGQEEEEEVVVVVPEYKKDVGLRPPMLQIDGGAFTAISSPPTTDSPSSCRSRRSGSFGSSTDGDGSSSTSSALRPARQRSSSFSAISPHQFKDLRDKGLLPTGMVDYFVTMEAARAATATMGPPMPQPPPFEANNPPPPTAFRDAEVTARFPTEDRDGYPFPTKVEWFCFPSGVEFVESEAAPPPRFHSFVMQTSGLRSYGVCLCVYRSAIHVGGGENDDDGDGDASGGESDVGRAAKTWEPLCVCLLTRLPIVGLLRRWLTGLHRLLSNGGRRSPASPFELSHHHALCIEAYIAQLALEVPLPVPGVLDVSFEIDGVQLCCSLPAVNRGALPARSHPRMLETLVRVFGGRGAARLLAAALCESKILLHCRSGPGLLLSTIAEALLCLLYPFTWTYPYIPCLPQVLLEYLQAPLPYVLGINTDWLHVNGEETLHDAVVVDCDSGQIAVGPGAAAMCLEFPPDQRRFVATALQRIVRRRDPAVLDVVTKTALAAESPEYQPPPPPDFVEHQIQVIAAEAVVSLLDGYRDCLFFVGHRMPVFNRTRFLKSKPPEARPFLRRMLETQLFSHLLETQDAPHQCRFRAIVDRRAGNGRRPSASNLTNVVWGMAVGPDEIDCPLKSDGEGLRLQVPAPSCSSTPEYDRSETERSLARLSAAITGLQTGAPVDFGGLSSASVPSIAPRSPVRWSFSSGVVMGTPDGDSRKTPLAFVTPPRTPSAERQVLQHELGSTLKALDEASKRGHATVTKLLQEKCRVTAAKLAMLELSSSDDPDIEHGTPPPVTDAKVARDGAVAEGDDDSDDGGDAKYSYPEVLSPGAPFAVVNDDVQLTAELLPPPPPPPIDTEEGKGGAYIRSGDGGMRVWTAAEAAEAAGTDARTLVKAIMDQESYQNRCSTPAYTPRRGNIVLPSPRRLSGDWGYGWGWLQGGDGDAPRLLSRQRRGDSADMRDSSAPGERELSSDEVNLRDCMAHVFTLHDDEEDDAEDNSATRGGGTLGVFADGGGDSAGAEVGGGTHGDEKNSEDAAGPVKGAELAPVPVETTPAAAAAAVTDVPATGVDVALLKRGLSGLYSSVARRMFVQILRQPGKHSSSTPRASRSMSSVDGTLKLKGYCLQKRGFECLVQLAKVCLNECAARDDYACAHRLLHACTEYHRLTNEDGTEGGAEEAEFLVDRIAHHAVFRNMQLWEDVLRRQLRQGRNGARLGRSSDNPSHPLKSSDDSAAGDGGHSSEVARRRSLSCTPLSADSTTSCTKRRPLLRPHRLSTPGVGTEGAQPNPDELEAVFELVSKLVYEMLSIGIDHDKSKSFVRRISSFYRLANEQADELLLLIDNVVAEIADSRLGPACATASASIGGVDDRPDSLTMTDIRESEGSIAGPDWREYDLDAVIRRKVHMAKISRRCHTRERHNDLATAPAGPISRNTSANSLADSDCVVPAVELSSAAMRASAGPVVCMDMSHHGHRVVTGSTDGSVVVWDLQQRRQMCVLGGHTATVSSVRFCGGGGGGGPRSVWAISASHDQTIRLWAVRTHNNTDATPEIASSGPDRSTISGSALPPARRSLLSRFASGLTSPRTGDGDTGGGFGGRGSGFTPALRADRVSADELGSRCLRTMRGHKGAVLCLDVIQEHKASASDAYALGVDCDSDEIDGLVATGSVDRTVKLWRLSDLSSGGPDDSSAVLEGHRGAVTCLHSHLWHSAAEQSSTDACGQSSMLLSGSRDGGVRLWDLTKSACVREFRGHSAGVLHVRMWPGHWLLASSSNDRTMRIWDPRASDRGGLVAVLSAHTGPVECFALGGPADPTIVTGSADGTVRLWDLGGNGGCQERLVLRHHSARVTCVERDYTKIISASDDGSLALWDINTGEYLGSYSGHRSGISCIRACDTHIVSGSWDASVRMWFGTRIVQQQEQERESSPISSSLSGGGEQF